MASTDVISLISGIIKNLEATAEAYTIVNNDKTLPEAFHEAGRGLPIVGEALKTAETGLQKRDQAEDAQNAISILGVSNERSKLSRGIFKDVSEAQETSRFECYKAAVQSRGELVEMLVVEMMKDTYALAKDSAIEATMEPHIMALGDAIDKLSKMESSVPNGQSGNTFSHWGSGDQFNAIGRGTQNINKGSGHQFTGVTFSGSVTF
ncbi:hypothetical protein B0I35DRAFT_113397 [Stachybotrys elegans]|uniref:NACHT-NTPase and P-loop NTPases N-terminal domain-containing protein n=1 Tax=Stachybotrys elegans TaxID=80388 RepID=A0A8K0SJB2_9HYPO|nr:hypothetical protein B0I35DRAFT_113397 [Stachybotrys elegans]